jgi:hypothetical protein
LTDTISLERLKEPGHAVEKAQAETLSCDIGDQSCCSRRDWDSAAYANRAGQQAEIEGRETQADTPQAAGGLGRLSALRNAEKPLRSQIATSNPQLSADSNGDVESLHRCEIPLRKPIWGTRLDGCLISRLIAATML